MKPEPAWPLHPPPGDVDTLRQYVQSLARQYGVNFESFCFYALNIAHEDEEARSFMQPTEDVLERLSIGLGMSVSDCACSKNAAAEISCGYGRSSRRG